MQPPRFITKSAFIQGYDCPQRLRYGVVDGLPSKDKGDDFLRMLAEGGFQFELLVRHAWPGETLGGFPADYEKAHRKTFDRLKECLAQGEGVLHEAVFVSGNLFARVDMLRIRGPVLELCEIKGKSFDGPVDAIEAVGVIPCACGAGSSEASMLTKPTRNKAARVRSGWRDYVADIGFQLCVVERALAAEGIKSVSVSPRLMVANKNQAACGYDWFGNVLAQVSIDPADSSQPQAKLSFISVPPPKFRSPMIAEVDVADAIKALREKNAQSESVRWRDKTLDQLIDDASQIVADQLSVDISAELGWKCRSCQYSQSTELGKPSGLQTCWSTSTASAENLFQLYRGRTYTPPELSDERDVDEDDEWVVQLIAHRKESTPLTIGGLRPEELSHGNESSSVRRIRRARQIAAMRSGRAQFSNEFAGIVAKRLLPISGSGILRFVDFETTQACLPYAIGLHPYQVVAFQFSVHALVVKNGSFDLKDIQHVETLFIGSSAETDILASDIAFATALRAALTDPVNGVADVDGPVFHWASHERTVLRMVSERLAARGGHDDLVAWIDATSRKEDDDPPGRLVDLLRIAEANTFHPLQHGRFSIKKFLPAICSETETMQDVSCLGFRSGPEDREADGCVDPYKGLPSLQAVLGEVAPALAAAIHDEDDSDDEGEGIRNGTSAMRAYQQLRFKECVQWSDATKRPMDDFAVRKALLRYCELDTAAMVVVWSWLLRSAKRC